MASTTFTVTELPACLYAWASEVTASIRSIIIICLRDHHPDLFRRAIALEDNARPNLKTVQGLGRNYSWKERFGKENCKHGNC